MRDVAGDGLEQLDLVAVPGPEGSAAGQSGAGRSSEVHSAHAWIWSLARALFRPATLVGVGLVVGALLPFDLLTAGVSFCPFKIVTGLPCPGCGMTRAVVALLHGDLATSVFYHPLGVPLVVAALVVGLLDAWFWWRDGRDGGVKHPPSWLMERVMLTPAPWVAIGALVLVWMVRLPLFLLGMWVY